MKIECPVCGAPLHHLRIDDGETINKILPNGEVIEIYSKSDGFNDVYCSDYKDHKLSFKLITKVLNLIN